MLFEVDTTIGLCRKFKYLVKQNKQRYTSSGRGGFEMQWIQNKITKTLGISAIRVIRMISIVFGTISLFTGGGDLAMLPAPWLAFAIVFVTGAVFFEARGRDRNRIAVSLIPHLRRSV
ncbi:MAG: hypothetical protein U9N12_08470 [Euryarchaeota archaeon]|nr:hypothetical protein [Euryarchaeota archaeon]